MERAAKRPRLAHGQDSNGASQNTHHNHQESSRFDGTGIAIRDGTVQVQGDLYVNSSHATGAANTIPTRQQILESLRFEQIDARQLSIKKALSKTCRWFLKTESYQQWSSRDRESNDDRFLWIKGKPGAGKSTLMRFLLEYNQSLAPRSNTREVLISFFFNARGESLEKSTVGLYRSLLWQLLEARPELQQVLDAVRPGRPWDTDLLKDLFDKAVQALEKTTIVCFVDALDECEEAQIRDMVQFLSDLVEDGSQLHICFASRHYPQITIQTGLSIILEDQDEHENDIVQYIDARLHLEQDKQAEEIRLELRKKASGVFIWVVLVVEILNREYEAGRTYALRQRLRQLPSDLHNLFRDILIRDTKDRNSLLLCIQWILFAKTPLTPEDLYFALIAGTEPAYLAQSHSEKYSKNSVRRFVLNNSKGLAEPTKSSYTTIQFIHESVRDFLLKEKGLCVIFPELEGNVIGQSHEALKRCCLTYISMESVANLGKSRTTTNLQFPFLAYANRNILHHANQAEINGLSQQDFLASFPLSRWVAHHNSLHRHHMYPYSPKVSLRYIMAQAGMPALTRALPTDQSCFDVEDERYGLPILAAAAAKDNDTVLAMLELEAQCLSNFSFQEFCFQHSLLLSKFNGRTPNFSFDKSASILSQLIHYGSEILCVFYLLAKDDSDLKGSQYGSLITQAIDNGFSQVPRSLIDRGAEFVTANRAGETPLHLATRRGCLELVEQLLDHGANVLASTKDGATPLNQASQLGYIEIAKLLLDHGADVSTTTNIGATPLHWASQRGHVKVAKLLLDRGADPSATTPEGATALHWASDNGHIEVAEMLLDYGANISANTVFCTTPLHRACKHGHVEVAKLLLDRGADTSATTGEGATALHWAANNADFKVAKLLLDYGANVSANTVFHTTPLHRASRYGHVKVAKLLLDRGADPSATTREGATPLQQASKNRHVEVVELLLNRGAKLFATTNDEQ